MKKQILATFFVSIMILSAISLAFAQSSDRPCDQCGMTVDVTGQARYSIVDGNGTRHFACCPVCALRLVKTYGELNITSFCDYNGPSYPITISAKRNGSVVTINPSTALILLGGGCPKNRLVFNNAAANSLLAPPNNGTSPWLSQLTNATVLPNATRLGLAQAALQYGGGAPSPCEQCGMTVDAVGQAGFRMLDGNGTTHLACCPVCGLKLLKTYGELNITSYCNWYGTAYPITMNIKQRGSEVSVAPSSALILVGGSCTKNRIVYNSTAADVLLAPPSNGTSKWVSPMSNDTVPINASRLTIEQAALQYGGGTTTPTPDPTPTPTPTPTPSPSPAIEPEPAPSTPGTTEQNQTSTKTCEACDMAVTVDDIWHFKVTDGAGNIHYVECYGCALNLIKIYETLHIQSFCDWYGPNYTITVDSTVYGAQVIVAPISAMYLNGGSCDANRVGYNQTAADALENGYSQFTSLFQQHDWAQPPTVMTVAQAVAMYNGNKQTTQTSSDSFLLPTLVGVAGVAALATGFVGYKKLRRKQS